MTNETVQNDLTESIKSGNYFQDAKDWYAQQFLGPIVDRSLMFVTAVITGIALLAIIITIPGTLPITSRLPFVVKRPNTTDYFSLMKPIAAEGEAPQEAVMQYLATTYVESRENYTYEQMKEPLLKQRLRNIKNTSSKEVFEAYQQSISKTNPKSPVVVLGRYGYKRIAVTATRFNEYKKTSGTIEVFFIAQTADLKAKTSKKQKGIATISYRSPDIEMIAKTEAPLRFVVTSYDIEYQK